jgi:hypothetical protein
MLAGPTQEPGVAVLGLAASLEPGELALDVPGEIQPRVRERRAHAGETLLRAACETMNRRNTKTNGRRMWFELRYGDDG